MASDVDPGNTAGLRTTESAVADDNAAEQTVREQSAEQTAVAATTEVAEEEPAQDEARASTLARGNETAGMPLPSSVAEQETGSRPPLQLKKRGVQLQPQHRLPRRRAPLARVRVL